MTQSQSTTTTEQNANGITKTDFTPPQPVDRLAKWRVEPNTGETPQPDAQATDTAKGAETQQQPAANPKSLNALAEKLGVEVKDLYDIEVPSAKEGESFTIGKLKDEMAKRDEFTARELQWEEDRLNREHQFREAQNELRTLLNALPRQALNKEFLAAVQQKAEQTAKVERQRTLDAIPEWKNEATMKQELGEIAEHLRAYGLDYLAQSVDSRLIKYIRESYLREARLKKALELVKEQRPQAIGKSKTAGTAVKKEQSAPANRDAKKMQRALDRWNSGS